MRVLASPPAALVTGALIAVQVLFGINYVVTKWVVSAFPPLVWASIRIVIAAIVLVAVASLLRRPHPKAGRQFFVPLIGYALLGTVINQACFLMGLSYTTPTNSAVLSTLIPVFTLAIVTVRGQEPLTATRVAGFLCAMAGVFVLRKIEDFKLTDQTVVGDLLTIINCLSYAFFLSYGKSFLVKYDHFWSTAWLFVYGSVGMSLISIPSWQGIVWPQMSPILWACVAYAVLGGTLLAYFLSNWALSKTHSSNVALWIYVQPAVAALFSWIWMDQVMTPRTLFSCGLIFTGMYLASKGVSRVPNKTAP